MMGDPQGKPASPSYELGFVKIGRNDPQEQWLVRMLHAMEPELKKEDSPMTFMAYGRGRVLLPCIGKGITRENLVYMIEFITSACSCTVKEQNPGVDLLVRYDWEAAAAKLAEKFAAEEGAPGMFYPELVIPSSAASNAQLAPAQDAKPAATAPGTSAEAPAAENASVAGLGKTESPPSAAPSPIEKKPPEAASKAEGAPAAAVAPEVSVASNTNRPPAKAAVPMAAEPGSSVSMYSSVVVVGGGVVIGLLALFGFTFYVLRSA
jgi:hypothetical protein